MRAFRFLFLLAVMAVFSVSPAQAEEAAPSETSTLQITGATLLQREGMLSFSATLHNNAATETTVRVGAIFYALAEGGDAASRAHRIAAPDSYTILAESDQTVSFVLPFPLLPTGEYRVMVGAAEDTMTRTFAQYPVATLNFENKNVVHIADCTLADQSFSEGLIEIQASTPTSLSCQAWVDSEGYPGRLLVKLASSPFGETTGLGVIEQRFSLEKTTAQLLLEHEFEPGLYEVTVSALDAEGRESGIAARVSVRVPGTAEQGLVVASSADMQTKTPAEMKNTSTTSVTKSSSLGFWLKAVAFVFAACVIVFLAFRRVRMGRGAVAGLVLFLGLLLGGLMPTHSTQAAQRDFDYFYNCSGNCPSATAIWMSVYTTKDVYAPGETIYVDAIIGSDDFPQGAPFGPLLRVQVNSGSLTSDLIGGSYTAQNLRGGVILSSINTGRVAPSSAGNFTLTISTAMGASAPGYLSPAAQSVTLSVASATPPTVTLNSFSPSTITAGNSSTISFSSTDATSCSGDAGSIWVGNLGGTSATNASTGPMTAGTYTQKVTCTGPTGLTGSSVTRTLIVNPSGATGSFTSTPACTIASGNAGCNTTVGWTTSGAASATLTNCADVFLDSSTGGAKSTPSVYVPYSSGCYRIHNGGTTGPVLAQTTITSSCTSGTSWDGSVCQGSTTYNCNAQTILGCQMAAVTNVSSSTSFNGICTYAESPSSISAGICNYYCVAPNTWARNNNTCITQAPSKFPLSGTFSTACGTTTGRLTWSDPSPNYGRAVTTDAGNRAHALYRNGILISEDLYSYNDSGLTPGATYTYTVQGSNQVGNGPMSDSYVVTMPNACSGGVTATITARGPVAFEQQGWWKRFISSVTGRDHVAQASGPDANITQGENASITWSSVNAVTCTVTEQGAPGILSTNLSGTLRLTGLSVGTHTYLITCRDSSGVTDNDSVNVIVNNVSSGAPGTPGGGGAGDFLIATAGACGSGTINIIWNSEAGATSYQLRDGSTQIYDGAATSFSHTGLVAGSMHNYTVRATNSSGSSSWSGNMPAMVPSPSCAGYTITASAAPSAGGNIAPSGVVSGIPSGSSQSFVINANAGYTIDSLSIDGIYIGPSNNYTFNNITANHTISVAFVSTTSSGPVCGNGICEGGEFCGVCVDCGFCGVSITANPNSCSIPANQNSCTTNLTWTSSAGTPRVTNSANTTLFVTQTGTNQPTSVVYPGMVFQIRDGNTIQGSTPFVSTSCASGSTWNVGLGRCVAATGTVSADPSCIIGLNQSTCNANFTWNITGATSPNLYNQTRNVTYSNSVSGNNAPFAVTNGANTVRVRDGSTVLDNTSVLGICDPVLAPTWNGTTCQASCSETVNCSTKEAEHCAGEAFTMAGACGQLNCTGTRACDYNWKEVSP